jgi:pyridoxal phosphate enzyme (YggS family)
VRRSIAKGIPRLLPLWSATRLTSADSISDTERTKTMSAQTLIAENVARVRERIAAAAAKAGRDANSIRLVAVSKYVDAATAALLLAAGCGDLGESRPQELWNKAADPRLAGAHWHLIGRLQRNKVARTVPLCSLIHSVDSEKLLAAIHEAASDSSSPAPILLEVNCSGEAAKQGFEPEAIRRLLPSLANCPVAAVTGLMTMAPYDGGEATARAAFAALRELRDELARSAPPNVRLADLSMGMSNDFEVAIAEGATIVRVGSALFEGVE